MRRHASTLIEVLLVAAIISMIASYMIPNYRDYRLHLDLEIAAQQTVQILHSAQVFSRSGIQGSRWGIYVPDGALFKGAYYSDRDPAFDEEHPFPQTVSVSGLTEVSFSPIYGVPSQTGTIILQSINGKRREIAVTGNNALPEIIKPDPPEPEPTEDPDVSIQVTFVRIDNSGIGDAEAATYVGPQATRYEDNAWIPLRTNGQVHIDSNFAVGVDGLAVERGDGFIRIFAEGDMPWPYYWWSMEIVDARVTFQGAIVDHIENDLSDPTEDPFDGEVSDTVFGDEVTTESSQSVLYQTRVNSSNDAIVIYWE